jgi:DNA-directed RNA polymerase specialized sigma24 family protein
MKGYAHEVETPVETPDETRNRLGSAMALLAPQSRRLMELWLQGWSRDAIAAEMRLSEDTAASHIDRAFYELRMILAR